jgi:hypothetical protein
MSRYFNPMHLEPSLGALGLLLMLLVARLTPAAYGDQRNVRGQLSGFVARRAIDAVAVLGWLADRLPAPAPVRGTALVAHQVQV